MKQIARLAVDGNPKNLTAEVHEIWSGVSVADVLDAASGEPRYDLYLLSFGDGTLFKHGTTRVVASICQHGFDPLRMSRAEVRAFAQAWRRDARRLKIDDGYIRWEDDEDD